MFNIFQYIPLSLRLYQLQFTASPEIYRIRFETNYKHQDKIDCFEISEIVCVSYEMRMVLLFRKNYHSSQFELHKCEFEEIEKVTELKNNKTITLRSQLMAEIPLKSKKENPLAIQIAYQTNLCYLYLDTEIYSISLSSLKQREGQAVISNKNFSKIVVNPKQQFIAIKQVHQAILFQQNGQFEGQYTNFLAIIIQEKVRKQTFQIPYPKNLLNLDDKQMIFPRISMAQVQNGDEILIKVVTQIRKYFVIQYFQLNEHLTPYFVSEEIRWNESQQYYLEIQSDKQIFEENVKLPQDSYTIHLQTFQSQMERNISEERSDIVHKIQEKKKLLESVFGAS